MNIGDLNTIVNIAKNVSFDFELPAFKVLDRIQVNNLTIIFFLIPIIKVFS